MLPTMRDRAMQALYLLALDPVAETTADPNSYGFRTARSAADAIEACFIALCRNDRAEWVLEGDIRSCFDAIQHEILLTLIAKRVADQRILKLLAQFLKAGVMEQGHWQRTELGTLQGAVCSPLLANIYFHQLDLFWWTHYGNLHRKAKERRRTNQQGNCALIRSADDWLLLTNGSKAEAYRLRDEFQRFLAEELKLELSVEKTHVPHVNAGFDFLGYHVRRYVSGHDRPKMLVTPSRKAQDRLKAKIKEMTARKRFRDVPLLKFGALKAVLRGWIQYYRYCNAKETAKDLDFWVNRRLFGWLQKRHRLPARQILAKYKVRRGHRANLGIRNGETFLYLYRMSNQPITKYRSRKPINPYLGEEWQTKLEQREAPLPDHVWLGNAAKNEQWRELKAEIKAERGARCERCGSLVNLDLHHIKARRYGGPSTKANAQLLCEPCHVQTPTYGDRSRLQ